MSQQQGSIFTRILNAQNPQPAPIPQPMQQPPQAPPQMPQGAPQGVPGMGAMPPPQMPQMPPQMPPQGFAAGGNVAAPAFRGYDVMDGLSNIAKSGGTFWLRDPKTGGVNPVVQAQVDQQKALAANRTPGRGEQRYGFVRFGEGMDPQRNNHSWQEKFSETKGAGLWAIGINPDDPQAEQKAKAYIERQLAANPYDPKAKETIWGGKTWGRDDAKMPGIRAIIESNPDVSYAELADYSRRALQAQNALKPKDIGLDIGSVLALALPVIGPAVSAGLQTLKVAGNEGDFGDVLLAAGPSLVAGYGFPGGSNGLGGIVNGISEKGLMPYLSSQVSNVGNALSNAGNYAAGVGRGAQHLFQTGNSAMLGAAILPQVNNVNALIGAGQVAGQTVANTALAGAKAGASSAMQNSPNLANAANAVPASSFVKNQALVNSGANALKVIKAQSDAADLAAKSAAASRASNAAGTAGTVAAGAANIASGNTQDQNNYFYSNLFSPAIYGPAHYAKGGQVKRFALGGLNLPNPGNLPMLPQTLPMQSPMPPPAAPPTGIQALMEKYSAPSAQETAAAEERKKMRQEYLAAVRGAIDDEAPSKREMYMNIAASLLSPTKTGSIGESFANAAKIQGDYAKEENAARRANRAAQLQLMAKEKEFGLGDAEEALKGAQGMRSAAFTAEAAQLAKEAKAPDTRTRKVIDPKDGELYEVTEEYNPRTGKYDEIGRVPAGAESKTAQAQKLALKGEGDGSFGGSFEGRVNDILAKGVKNPDVRKTPEYARAYDIATQPKQESYLDLETGETKVRLVKPSLNPIFLPPIVGGTEPAETAPAKPAGPAASGGEGAQTDVVTKPGLSTLTTAEAAELRKQALALDDLNNALNALQKDVEQNGLQVLSVGEGGGKQASTYNQLLIKMKEAANLGALTGPDMALMIKTIGDPTKVMTAIKGGGGPKYFLGQLDSYRQMTTQKRNLLSSKLPGGQVKPRVYDPETGTFSGGDSGK